MPFHSLTELPLSARWVCSAAWCEQGVNLSLAGISNDNQPWLFAAAWPNIGDVESGSEPSGRGQLPRPKDELALNECGWDAERFYIAGQRLLRATRTSASSPWAVDECEGVSVAGVAALAIGPRGADGRLLAVDASDGSISGFIIDEAGAIVPSGRIAPFVDGGQKGQVNALAISSCGTYLGALRRIGGNYLTHIYPTADLPHGTPAPVGSLRHNGAVCLAWNPTFRSVLATGGSGGHIFIWTIARGGGEPSPHLVSAGTEPIVALAWSNDGNVLVARNRAGETFAVLYSGGIAEPTISVDAVLGGNQSGPPSDLYCRPKSICLAANPASNPGETVFVDDKVGPGAKTKIARIWRARTKEMSAQNYSCAIIGGKSDRAVFDAALVAYLDQFGRAFKVVGPKTSTVQMKSAAMAGKGPVTVAGSDLTRYSLEERGPLAVERAGIQASWDKVVVLDKARVLDPKIGWQFDFGHWKARITNRPPDSPPLPGEGQFFVYIGKECKAHLPGRTELEAFAVLQGYCAVLFEQGY